MNNTQQKQVQSPGEGQWGRQISNQNFCPTLPSSYAGKIQNAVCSVLSQANSHSSQR